MPSIPFFLLAPLYAQTFSRKPVCIQEGCSCPQGKFHLWSAVCLLCPSDPLCNQSVCLQIACLLCLLLLVHKVHLVTTCIFFNKHLYQSTFVLPVTHIWMEESQCASFLGWSSCMCKRPIPNFLCFWRNFLPLSFLHPQTGTLFLPVYNFPMLFFCIFGVSRLCAVFIVVTAARISPPEIREHFFERVCSHTHSALNFSQLHHLNISVCALSSFLYWPNFTFSSGFNGETFIFLLFIQPSVMLCNICVLLKLR